MQSFILILLVEPVSRTCADLIWNYTRGSYTQPRCPGNYYRIEPLFKWLAQWVSLWGCETYVNAKFMASWLNYSISQCLLLFEKLQKHVVFSYHWKWSKQLSLQEMGFARIQVLWLSHGITHEAKAVYVDDLECDGICVERKYVCYRCFCNAVVDFWKLFPPIGK